MLREVNEARASESHQLYLRFNDGTEGTIDVAQHVQFSGVFAPLCDPKEFAHVRVNSESGAIEWPCGVDLDPDVLYSLVSGNALPNFDSTPSKIPE